MERDTATSGVDVKFFRSRNLYLNSHEFSLKPVLMQSPKDETMLPSVVSQVTGIQIKTLTTFKNLSLVERPFLTQIQGFNSKKPFGNTLGSFVQKSVSHARTCYTLAQIAMQTRD